MLFLTGFGLNDDGTSFTCILSIEVLGIEGWQRTDRNRNRPNQAWQSERGRGERERGRERERGKDKGGGGETESERETDEQANGQIEGNLQFPQSPYSSFTLAFEQYTCQINPTLFHSAPRSFPTVCGISGLPVTMSLF